MRTRAHRYIPRRPQRHTVRLACQIVRERDFCLIANEVVELSESGLLVRPLVRVLTGEPIILTLMAPFTRTFVDAEGTVARVDHGRRLIDDGPRLGIAFDSIDSSSLALLREQLRFLPAAAPRHRMPS